MKFLFIRNYLLFVLVIFCVGAAGVYFTDAAKPSLRDQNAHLITQGVFTVVIKELKEYPISTRESALAALQPEDGNRMSLIMLSQLPADFPNRAGLVAGKIIADYDKHGGYVAPSAYKRIGKTNQVLKLAIRKPEAHVYRVNSAWMRQMINVELRKTPTQYWPDVMSYLSRIFETPIKFEPKSKLSLKQLKYLHQYHVLFKELDKGSIATMTFVSPDPARLIVLGPMVDSIGVRYQSFIFYGVCLFALLVACFLWTYPFYRNLNKLKELSDEYGKGHFDATAKVPRTLALHPLHTNMTRMAGQIKSLIQSHKELVSAVSHELRTPLARLKFQTRALEKAPKAKQAAIIKGIDEDVAELDELIDEMLVYAAFDRSKVSLSLMEHDLGPFVHDMVVSFQSKYPDKKWMFKNLAGVKMLKEIDAHQFTRAMQNLCLNAYRYGDKTIYVTVDKTRDGIAIRVEDDGPGIDPENADRIFKPFEQLDSSRNKSKAGYGLGLSIVEKIVIAHGATISVSRSTLGGACFEILF